MLTIYDRHPRPQFAREEFYLLDGQWDFEFDTEDAGIKQRWFDGKTQFKYQINVPYVYQSELSGITDAIKSDVVWYKRKFTVPFNKGAVMLNFGAVDYKTDVYVNGFHIGEHKGGYTGFNFNISDYINDGENLLVVRVEDKNERFQPRGKQYLPPRVDRCWYIESTGIWQSVWLECAGVSRLESLQFTPDIKTRIVKVEACVNNFKPGDEIQLDISFEGRSIKNLRCALDASVTFFTFYLREQDFVDELHYWKPESPSLYYVSASLISGGIQADKIFTYFGMRSMEIRDGHFYLNNNPYYQKLVLDQGYFKDAIYTGTDEQMKYDVRLIKSYGFNGVRMHQKIESPRFYYWADVLGLLVWGEIPSAYEFCTKEVENYLGEITETVKLLYNCPSVITWVPLNESWGVRNIRYDKMQQNFARGVYELIKSIDSTRLVTANDGWEVAGGDFVPVHNYYPGGQSFSDDLSDMDKYASTSVNNFRAALVDGEKIGQRPILLSEFGGIGFVGDGWGYAGQVNGEEDFIKRFTDLFKRTYANKLIEGFCYTQLTDVYQETNGLTDMERNNKISPEKLKNIVNGEF